MKQRPVTALDANTKIMISVGGSRRETRWRSRELSWEDLLDKLSTPTRTPETIAEYQAMPKPKRDDLKDVGGFVGGTLKGGRRKADAVAWRRLITLDLDSVPAGVDPWQTAEALGVSMCMYSTHSHTPKSQRLRLVIPLSREVTSDEYAAIARRVAADVGIDMCDDTTYEPHRLMYWPSCSSDAVFRFESRTGPWLDADAQLARYDDWRDPFQWPQSSRKTEALRRTAAKQGDPTEKPGVVGAFCRIYPIEDAIEQFLKDVYEPFEGNRYTFLQGSGGAGGVVVYDKGKFAYSHHGTDPCGGRLCNAFDLVRLHKFGDLDDDAEPGTAMTKLPSYAAMTEFAMEGGRVREDLAARRIAEVEKAFDGEDDTTWLQKLDMTAKGQIATTVNNVKTILQHDPNLKDRYGFDEFRKRAIVFGDMPWLPYKKRMTDGWTDFDDTGLRWYLERTYKLDGVLKIRDGADAAMRDASFHPVRDWLSGLTWDGELRADTLLIEHLGAEDDAYTRAVTRKALIGAVARIFDPGCKHDHILVLVGPQGCGKSTILQRLGGKWYSDSLYTVQGKDAFEQIQGYWIIEMGEMAAFKKAEVEAIKQFVSKRSDNFRAAYGRCTQEHPRQCAFFGTTNDDEFLHDATGGRRFWPVIVTGNGENLFETLPQETVEQVWAEAVVYYRAGEPWYLDAVLEPVARSKQKDVTETSARTGQIQNFLNVPLLPNWDALPLEKRIEYFHGDGFSIPERGIEERQYVCPLEVWQELYKGDPKTFDNARAREINNVLRSLPDWEYIVHVPDSCLYGRSRGFMRKQKRPAGRSPMLD